MRSPLAFVASVGTAVAILGAPAQAAVIVSSISSVPGYSNSTPAVIDFEQGSPGYLAFDAALGFDWSGSANVIPPPSVPGVTALPFGDTSKFYMSVPAVGGSETLTVNTALLGVTGLSSLKIFIGSLDTFNSITFFSGGSSQMLSGTDLLNSIPTPISDSGNQHSDATNREFTFTFAKSFPVTSIEFDTTQNAFEFDNLNPLFPSTRGGGGGIPEPSAWVVMLTGFALLGLALRSRALNWVVGA